ncbi:hypothetical protein FQN60_005957 [Etheostoma spectabile]|uniref:Uncharacterized protein n=1 Tax=Etheostoma spectabile TaxID=54343 RepID=A0A5J5CET1_9PERO|nr:hypothetical protein FQN60_005957 [Etheostoma spectabile]
MFHSHPPIYYPSCFSLLHALLLMCNQMTLSTSRRQSQKPEVCCLSPSFPHQLVLALDR